MAQQYQLPNPQALDPYQIETSLAKDDTPHAMNLLGLYRSDRALAGQNYQHELDAQHSQARNDLIARIQDNNAKHMIDAGGKSGVVGLLRSLPQFAHLFGPDADGGAGVGAFTAGQTNLQNADVANKGSDAVYKLAQSGMPTSLQGASNITGLPVSQGVPLGVQEQLARAASTPRPPDYTFPMHVGTVGGTAVQYPVRIPYGSTPEQEEARIRQGIATANRVYTGLQLEPGLNRDLLPPGVNQQPVRPLAPGSSRTNLPSASAAAPTQSPTATASPTQSGGTTQERQITPAQIIRDPKLQKAVKLRLGALGKDANLDIGDYMVQKSTGGSLPIVMAPDGKSVYVKGLTRNYPIEIR